MNRPGGVKKSDQKSVQKKCKKVVTKKRAQKIGESLAPKCIKCAKSNLVSSDFLRFFVDQKVKNTKKSPILPHVPVQESIKSSECRASHFFGFQLFFLNLTFFLFKHERKGGMNSVVFVPHVGQDFSEPCRKPGVFFIKPCFGA